MEETALSVRALEVAVKQAVKSTSTCTSETTSLLQRLLAPSSSAGTRYHDEYPKDVKQTRQTKSSTSRRATKPAQSTTRSRNAISRTRGENNEGLSQREKLVLATEVFNSASKALSDYVKLSSTCQSSRQSIRSIAATPQKKLTPRRPLQPVSPNSIICSPVKTKNAGAATPKKGSTTCGIVEVANCARFALSCLRDLSSPAAEGAPQFNSQLEQGFCVLIGKLLAIGLNESAITELRKLKRRINGYLGSESAGVKSRVVKRAGNSRQRDEPSKETLADLIQIDKIPSDNQLMNLVISFQTHSLKAIAAEKKPPIVSKLHDLLLLSNPTSPASIILAAWKKGILSNEKAAQQLQSLSYTMISLASSAQSAEDSNCSSAEPRGKGTTTVILQILSLEIRCTWWKIGGHRCDMEKELWYPLARYLASFARRCSAITKSDFEIVKEAFLRLESTVTTSGYAFIPPAGAIGSVSTVMKVLGQLAQSADCKADALKFYNDCISHLTPDQPLLLGICNCKVALIRLETLRNSKIGRASKTVSAVSEAVKCLASPLRGNQSDLEELVIESAKLKKAAMSFLNALGDRPLDDKDGDLGHGQLGLYIINYLNSFVGFLTRYLGQALPTRPEASDGANSLFQQRMLKSKNIILAAVDSVVAVGKISVVAKRPSWTDIQPLLSDSLILLKYLHSMETIEHEVDATNSTSASFIKLSNLHWSRYVKQKEAGACPSDLIALLERSTSLLQTCPPENPAGFAAIKYERLATLYSEISQTKKSKRAYQSAIQVHINSGALKCASEDAATKPTPRIFKEPSFTLGRVLSSYARFCWKHNCDFGEAVFDDANLRPEERGILLEGQLTALLDIPADNKSDGRVSPLSFLVSGLLAQYTRGTYPIRRLRIILQTIRLLLQDPNHFGPDFLEIILADANLFLNDDFDVSKDAGLSMFKENMLTSLRLTLGLWKGDLPTKSLRKAIDFWASITQSCPTWASLLDKIDDPELLISQLKIFVSYFEVRGLWDLRISALSTLRHVLSIQETKNVSEIIMCLSRIGLQYTRLGYLEKAESVFSCGQAFLQNTEVSALTLISWNIGLAEYLAEIGDFDKATEVLSGTKAGFEENTTVALKSSFQVRLNWERLVAEAAYVYSRIYFELGSVDRAIYFAKCAVKLNNRIWAKLDRLFEMKRHKTSSDSSDSDIDALSSKVEAVSLSSDSSCTGNDYQEGSLYWPHFTSHYVGLVNLSKLSAHNGLFQDCVYYAEQALKMCKAIGATSPTSFIQAELGNAWLRGGHIEKAQDLLGASLAASGELNQSLEMVSRHIVSAVLHRQQGNQEERSRSLDVAHQTLLEISSRDMKEATSDEIMEPTIEAKMSELTIKPKSQSRKARVTRQSRARRAKVSENPPSNSRTPATPVVEASSFSHTLSQLHFDLLHQQIIDLVSTQDFAGASALLEQAEQLPKSKSQEMFHFISRAQYLLSNWVQRLSTHSVYCVLPESTISLPSIYLAAELAEEKPSSANTRGTRRLPQSKRSKAAAVTAKGCTRTGVAEFADMESALNHLLPVISSSVPIYGSTSDNHGVSFLSTQLGMISHATSAKLEGCSDPLRSAITIENGRNLAFSRESSSIAIDKELCGPVEPLKWPSADTDKTSHQLECTELMQNQIDILPDTWNVLSMTLSDDRNEFIISKMRAGKPPFLLRLPMKRGNSEDMDEEEFDFDEGKAELLEIIQLANESAHDAKARVDKDSKKEWWANRETLDNRLKDLLSNIEAVWFGGFRGIFCPNTPNRSLFARFIDSFENILDKHLPSRQRGRSRVSKVDFHWDVMELFVNIGTVDEGSDPEDLVTDLLYFVVDILQFQGERNAYDEIDFDMMVIETLDAIRHYRELEERARTSVPSSHTILILDKELHSFPWESLECLRGSSVSRMPSLQHLKETLSRLQASEDITGTPDGLHIDRKMGSYILNPGGDLKSTQTTFESSLLNLEGWSGIANREPSEDEFKQYLESKDLLLYFGHGSGAQYIRGRTIKRLDRCAVTFLMGCSSGSLTEAGEFEPYGTPINYMHAGAPALVATLWDVTDKDIDRFAQSTFEQWGLMKQKPVETKQSGKPGRSKAMKAHQTSAVLHGDGSVGLDTAVANSRNACLLRYLNGAAPVVYGVPVFLK